MPLPRSRLVAYSHAYAFLTQFCIKPYVPRELRRDPSNRRLLWTWDMIYNISDTARNRTRNLFRPKCAPIPPGHSDGQSHSDTLSWQQCVIAPLGTRISYNSMASIHTFSMWQYIAEVTILGHSSPFAALRMVDLFENGRNSFAAWSVKSETVVIASLLYLLLDCIRIPAPLSCEASA